MPANSSRSPWLASSALNSPESDVCDCCELTDAAACCARGMQLAAGKNVGQQSLHYSTTAPRLTGNTERSSGCFLRLWERLCHTSKEWASVLRKDPRTLVAPLVLMLVLMALGITGVVITSDMQNGFMRQEADNVMMDTVGALEGAVDTAALPTAALAAFVRLRKNYTVIKHEFTNVSDQLLTQASSRIVKSLQLSPAGIIMLTNPLAGNERALGLNILNSSTQAGDALQAIRAQRLMLTGPMMIVQGYMGIVARLPIFISKNESGFFFPLGDDLPAAPVQCEGCETQDSVFWGFASVLLDLGGLLSCTNRVGAVRDRGFYFRVSKPYNNSLESTCHSRQESMNIVNNSMKALVAPRCARAVLPNAVWCFCLSPRSGWTVWWLYPMIALAALTAALLSVLAFAVLVSRRQHQLLLQTMLPSKVIRQLKTLQHFVESFQNVTILFSDIAGFDDLVEGVPPEDVVQLLDEVYSIYDRLVDKHKVYKVETIGDAFMCAAGCPEKEDPVKAAASIAHMAADMLRHTKDLVTSGGFRICVRIGVASGPVVAAVIGERMPRYCLFGDTVNIASRMETSGRALSIHMSSSTAELLLQNEDKSPELTLQCRGQITVKGKGLMTTYWLCPPDLPAPNLDLTYKTYSIATTEYDPDDAAGRTNTPTSIDTGDISRRLT